MILGIHFLFSHSQVQSGFLVSFLDILVCWAKRRVQSMSGQFSLDARRKYGLIEISFVLLSSFFPRLMNLVVFVILFLKVFFILKYKKINMNTSIKKLI